METVTRNWVLVRIECRRCHATTEACVRVSREVPTPLRCTPGGRAVGGGSSTCSCGAPWPWAAGDLQRAVEEELRKGGWGRHIRAGAVLLEF